MERTWDARNLWVNTFAAFNGGDQTRKWSLGYWSSEERTDDTWNEVKVLPDETPWPEVQREVRLLQVTAEATRIMNETATFGALEVVDKEVPYACGPNKEGWLGDFNVEGTAWMVALQADGKVLCSHL